MSQKVQKATNSNKNKTKNNKSKTYIRPKKSLGQNFLQNKQICKNIVEKSSVSNMDLILEIGPGQMALTNYIIEACNNIIIIEKDVICFSFVLNYFTDNNFTVNKVGSFYTITKDAKQILLLNADAMDCNFCNLIEAFNKYFNKNFNKLSVVANLPYNVGTLLVYKWCETDYLSVHSITIMLQKEVAQRIVAKNKTKDYGKLSVICQMLFNCNVLFDVSGDNFFPAPKVVSSVINLVDNLQMNASKIIPFCNFLTLAFSKKRKTLLNVFKGSSIDFNDAKNAALKNMRIEDLNPQQIYDIFINN